MSDLPEMVQALLAPETYPERPAVVELVQTQMSFVFLAGDYVYKIKKPVDLGYLDYTTLQKRRHFCEQEVTLNRRLCPDAYLGVVPVTEREGGYRLGGEGVAVEYAVKMRRLPREGMLDVMLAGEKVTEAMMAAVAEKLAGFHARAETSSAIIAFGRIDAITRNTDENFAQTEKYVGQTLARETYDRIKSYTEGFIQENERLFDKRVADGRIRDCHGDLHAAHVCFTDGICIYDCIEFNDRFRYSDIAAEVAFLAMDLDHYGRADLSRRFVDTYIDKSGDAELKELLKFYQGYRAYVRGKVACFQLDDPYIARAEKERIRGVATGYFDLSVAYTRKRPLLVITVGLVGTGKSALARTLAGRFGLAVISSDVTRKRLAGIPPTEHRFEEFHSGIYSADFNRLTYDTMFTTAVELLGKGTPVILDAAFLRAGERERAQEIARAAGADFLIIECRLDEAAIQERLARRLVEGSVSDGRPEVLEFQRGIFEPVTADNPAEHLVIDTSPPVDELVDELRPAFLEIE